VKTLLSVRNLKKSYGDIKALKGISFDVYEKEVLCFLGPNGAGKSTTINILSSILTKDEGEITYEGQSFEKNLSTYKASLGIVPQDLAIYEEISALNNVKFYASLYGLKGEALEAAALNALDNVGLLSVKHRKPKTFSGGMKRRLNIACGVAHQPKVIIFDEPTVGIDPQSRHYILNYIKALKDQGVTVIYTSHYMEEVEDISTRILIIDHGEILTEGTKEDLKKMLGDTDKFTIDIEANGSVNTQPFYRIDGVKGVEVSDNRLMFDVVRGVDCLDKIIAEMIDQHIKLSNLNKEKATLERVFLHLTGHALRG